jgi:ribonuclease Y
METPTVVIISCLAALGGLVGGFAGARLVSRSRLKTIRSEAAEILRVAREEADKVRKEAELKAKDDLYQQREEHKRETEQVRAELREQGLRLTRREDGLEEKHQALMKKERSL